MSDACEMMVAAELTLAGIPALKVPANWPGYDVIAQRLANQIAEEVDRTLKANQPKDTFRRSPGQIMGNAAMRLQRGGRR